MSALSHHPRAFSTRRGPRRRHLLVAAAVLALTPFTACDDPLGLDPVGSIIVSPADPELIVGESVQLVATVLSESGSVLSGYEVDWTSSAAGIAGVSTGGLLDGVSAGIATIEARAEDATAVVTATISAGTCAASHADGMITPGGTVSGSLSIVDCEFGIDGAPARGYALELDSATTLRIDLSSVAFWPFILVTDRQMREVGWGWGDGDQATMVGDLDAGRYIVWASSEQWDATGPFELAVHEATRCDVTTVSDTIEPGETATGELYASSCLFFVHDGPAVGYHLALAETEGLRIDLTSAEFDPVVVITDSAFDILWWDDDGGEDLNSRLESRLAAGNYIIWATGYDPSQTGSFQLAVDTVDIPICPTLGDIAVGDSIFGELTTSDCMIDDMWFSDPWRFVLEVETTVRVDLTSDQFDTFLYLEDAEGASLAWDDDGGYDLNSRLVRTLPAGEYRAVASSWGTGVTGTYALTIAESASAAAVTEGGRAGAPAPWSKESKP